MEFLNRLSGLSFRIGAVALIAAFRLCTPTGQLHAQDLGPENRWLQGLNIRSIGPAGMSGRVTGIAVVREDPSIIYIATASGGLWKSQSGGIEWKPVFDHQPTQSIGAVAIDPSNAQVIWAGTGEGNPRNSHNSGMGIFRSPDGGRSWQSMGLEATRTIHRIIVHPNDPNTVYIGALGSAWGPNEERGVYRTRDGGKTWEKILSVNDSTGCADLVIDPTNPNKLIAAMWEYGRKPWTFHSGGKGSGVYLTHDGGDNWNRVSNNKNSGFPEGDLGRIGLAIAPSEPHIVYAIVEAKENALFRSEDGGFTWSKQAVKGIGNRPFYYSEIYVDPKNENRIYSLYSMVSRSEDGGKNWEVIIPYSGVHPDHHAFYIHPDNPDFLIDGNDGGLAISRDRGASWRFVENLPLGQFYHIAVDRDMPYHIYGGLQDNGSWVGPAYEWQSGGIRNANWTEVLFGDGFDVQPHPANSRYGYAMWQGGNLNAYDRETGENRYIRPVHPEGIKLRFNWNAALALDPFDPNGVYYGSQFVHYSTDEGRTWRILSPDLTSNDTSRQKQAQSGGLTRDVTTAENYTTLLCIAPSPLERSVIWTGSDDGRLHITRDRGSQWTAVQDRLPGAPTGAWIPQIVASTHDAGQAFIVLNDYRRNHWEPYAYRTDDFGKSFKRIAGPDQIRGHVWSIAQDIEVADLLFLGSDQGLWFSLDGGLNWQVWSKDFPAVSVSDLVIQPDEGDLVVGTFGRAIWVLDDLEPLRALARQKNVLNQPFHLFDVPPATLAEYRTPPGVRFDANAGFRGENRPGSARLTFWINPSAFPEKTQPKEKQVKGEASGKKKTGELKEGEAAASTPSAPADSSRSEKKPDPEKIYCWVFNASGDTIRSYSLKADTGFVRRGWDMRVRGPRYPSNQKRKKDDDEPAGRMVTPGNYTIIAEWMKHRDTAHVIVREDPRFSVSPPVVEAYSIARDRYESVVRAAGKATEQLLEASATMNRLNDQLESLPDSSLKSLRKTEKAVKDSIAQLQGLILTPEDFKGYDGEDRLMEYIELSSNMLNRRESPSTNTLNALSDLEERASRILVRINRFFDEDWKRYRDQVETLPWSPFPEIKPLRIE